MRNDLNPDDFFSVAKDPTGAARFLVQCAGQAPSSHNTQPWIFKILSNSAHPADSFIIEVYGDPHRMLLLSDPDAREFFISIGCAIENILVAADYYNLSVEVAYFPDAKQKLFVARIMVRGLLAANKKDGGHHLVFEIEKRHANREPFAKDHAVPEAFVEKIMALAQPGYRLSVVVDKIQKAVLAKIAGDATFAAFKDKGFCRELSQWIKPSSPKYPDGMPGYNLGIPWPISFVVPLAIRYGDVAKAQRKMVDAMVSSTPLFLVISTDLNEPRDWVEAGRILEHIWLMATGEGIKMGLLGAPIEIGSFYTELQAVLHLSSRPQIFCRLGYAPKIPPKSPRLPVDAIMQS